MLVLYTKKHTPTALQYSSNVENEMSRARTIKASMPTTDHVNSSDITLQTCIPNGGPVITSNNSTEV